MLNNKQYTIIKTENKKQYLFIYEKRLGVYMYNKRNFGVPELQTHYISLKKNTFVTYAFIAICVVIFILDGYLNYSLTVLGIKSNEIIRSNPLASYRLITCALLHVSIPHLVFNMLMIVGCGKYLEQVTNHLSMLIVIFDSALMASLASFAFSSANSLGASGVVFGIMGAILAVIYAEDSGTRRKVKKVIIPCLILNLVVGLFSTSIDNFAHLGGLLGGYLIGMGLGADNEYGHKEKRIVFISIYAAIAIILLVIGYAGGFNIDCSNIVKGLWNSIIDFIKTIA